MDYQLGITSLSHSYKDRVILSNSSIEFKTGEVTGIFGRNGSGKSTLFKILFGVLKPKSIEIRLNGQIQHQLDISELIAYHTQEIMLPQSIKVNRLISIYIQSGEHQDKIFYSPGIHEIQNLRVRNLSLGQQRYLQFLLILNLNHRFIMLDEPFSMVDPLYIELIKQKIIEYKSAKAFIITDHYYRDILEVSDRNHLIKDGTIKSLSYPEELITYGYI